MKKETNDYKAVLMSFDGEYVIDSAHSTIEEAGSTVAELGSKWIFYPWYFCVKGQTIVDAAGVFVDVRNGESLIGQYFIGKRFKTAIRIFKTLSLREEAQGLEVEDYESLLLAVIML
jgi:hypothetical protein